MLTRELKGWVRMGGLASTQKWSAITFALGIHCILEQIPKRGPGPCYQLVNQAVPPARELVSGREPCIQRSMEIKMGRGIMRGALCKNCTIAPKLRLYVGSKQNNLTINLEPTLREGQRGHFMANLRCGQTVSNNAVRNVQSRGLY